MYCKKCGHEIDDDSIFCSKCGTKQNARQESISKSDDTQPMQSMSVAKEHTEKKIYSNDDVFSFIGLLVPKGRRRPGKFVKLAFVLIPLMVFAFDKTASMGIKANGAPYNPFINLSGIAFCFYLLCIYLNAVNMSKRMMDCGYHKFTSFVLSAFFLFGSQLFLDIYVYSDRPFHSFHGSVFRENAITIFQIDILVYVVTNLILMFKEGTPGPNEYGEEPK